MALSHAHLLLVVVVVGATTSLAYRVPTSRTRPLEELQAAESRRTHGWFRGIGVGNFRFSEDNDGHQQQKSKAASEDGAQSSGGASEDQQSSEDAYSGYKDFYSGYHHGYHTETQESPSGYYFREYVTKKPSGGEDKPSTSYQGHSKLAFSTIRQTIYNPRENYEKKSKPSSDPKEQDNNKKAEKGTQAEEAEMSKTEQEEVAEEKQPKVVVKESKEGSKEKGNIFSFQIYLPGKQ